VRRLEPAAERRPSLAAARRAAQHANPPLIIPERQRVRPPLRAGSIAVLVASALGVAMTAVLAVAIYSAYRSEYSARVATLAERTAVINGHAASDLLTAVHEQDAGHIARVVGASWPGRRSMRCRSILGKLLPPRAAGSRTRAELSGKLTSCRRWWDSCSIPRRLGKTRP